MGRRWLVAVAIGVLLVVLVTACGSKKKSAATTTPTTTAAAATTTETTSAATTTSSSGSSGGSQSPSFASAKNCAQLASLASKVAQSATASGNGTVDLNREADAIKALADAAPSDIRPDFKTFAEAYASFAKVYASSGIAAGTAPSAEQIAKLTAAAKSLSTPKIQAAMQHLSSWASSNCGGLTSTSP
ncbi:MAG: hypothetical protein ACXVQQ_05750 [Gaiellaceae bacterium]